MAAAQKVVEIADVVEDVKDLTEDTVELVGDKVSWISSNPKALVVIASLVGVAAGSALGYLIASKKLSLKYQTIADEQIEDVKAHYSILRKDDVSLEDLASKYVDEVEVTDAEKIIEQEGYKSYDKVPTIVEAPATVDEIVHKAKELAEDAGNLAKVVEQNVFESTNPDTYFDFEEELQRRSDKPNSPFVLTKEEFDQGDADYDQTSLTYYDGDDVLADSSDNVVDDLDMVVGFENILRFGHGSGDPRIVYIRNSKLTLDFEVVHSDGKFAKEVLGFDDELEHSHKRQLRKFRQYDE